MPITEAIIAIPSGVDDKERAVAAGIINMDTISNTPTTFMPTATTIDKARVNTKLSLFGLKPFAEANSSFKVTNNKGDQRHIIRDKISAAPIHIKKRSMCDTAKISPIKYAIKSIRIPDMKDTITRAAASDICPVTPKRVSE